MMKIVKKVITLSVVPLLMGAMIGLSDLTANADVRDWLGNDIVKQGAIGAGVGAITGVVREDGPSTVKSAGIGAVTGAAGGAIDHTGVLDNNPLARRAAKGAIYGTGGSAVLGKSKIKGAAVGAGTGAGYHYLKKYLDNRN